VQLFLKAIYYLFQARRTAAVPAMTKVIIPFEDFQV